MTTISQKPNETYDDYKSRRAAIFDLRQNAQRKMTNFADKGFMQKHIDILYKLGYYRDNKSIFVGETN